MRAKGKIVEVKGKYFFTVGTQQHELIPNEFGDVKAFQSMLGKEVEGIMDGPNLVGLVHGAYCFLCYVPNPELRRILEIDPAIRLGLLNGFANAGIIDAAMAKKIDANYAKLSH